MPTSQIPSFVRDAPPVIRPVPAAAQDRAAAEKRLELLRKNTKAEPGSARPIIFAHFRLCDDALDVEGTPTLDMYTKAGGFIVSAERGSPFWLADWLLYGDSRAEWREQLQQAQSLSRFYTPETIEQYKRVARKVPRERRRAELSYKHHCAVESLAPSEQTELLDQAVTNGWTAGETRREAHALQRRGILRVQAPLEGKFRVIYADPPWLYSDRPPSGSGAQAHYPGMTIKELCKLPVAAHALKHSVLFMWVTSPMLYENPGPREVIEAWGFKYKASIAWDKVLHGFGHYVSIRHELLLICTRGSCTPDRPTPMPDSVQTFRRSDVHSEKPEEFRKLIMQLYDGPYVEYFARQPAEGWTTWGNQVLAEVVA